MLGTDPMRSSDNSPRPILPMTSERSSTFFIDRVDLLEDQLGVGRREIAAVLPREEADAERALGIFDEAADSRRRDIEEFCGTRDRAGNHYGTNDFDLSERHHRGPR